MKEIAELLVSLFISTSWLDLIPGILQELVDGILGKSLFLVVDHSPEEIDPGKRQREGGGKCGQRLCPSRFADAAALQQGSGLEIFQERSNPVMWLF
ncbi:MAG: hypothetical protein FWG62_06935 [Proteobacteria bacterium]|nr:hypothetical protein [Pseudomonadota bacterium]